MRQPQLYAGFGIAARSSGDLEDAQSIEWKGAPHRPVRKFDGLCEKNQSIRGKVTSIAWTGLTLGTGHGTARLDEKDQNGAWSPQRRNLIGTCLAHLLHDGYTDQLYALLPVWQSEFGLSYAGLAVVRALYSGTMGVLQVPADRLMVKLGARAALAIATFVAAAGYLVVALPLGFPGLCAGLILAGVGSSLQHPRASLMVTNSYGAASRGP